MGSIFSSRILVIFEDVACSLLFVCALDILRENQTQSSSFQASVLGCPLSFLCCGLGGSEG